MCRATRSSIAQLRACDVEAPTPDIAYSDSPAASRAPSLGPVPLLGYLDCPCSLTPSVLQPDLDLLNGLIVELIGRHGLDLGLGLAGRPRACPRASLPSIPSTALTLVFSPAASCFVVFLRLPPASSVESTLVVAENVSFFFSSCFFASRSSVKAGGGGPGVGGAGGVGVVTPLPASAAVGPPLPVLRCPPWGRCSWG